MKKRFFLCMISVMMIGVITGCQKADEEVDSTGIGTHEIEEIVTGESQPLGTENSSNDTSENDGERIYSLEEYGFPIWAVRILIPVLMALQLIAKRESRFRQHSF